MTKKKQDGQQTKENKKQKQTNTNAILTKIFTKI